MVYTGGRPLVLQAPHRRNPALRRRGASATSIAIEIVRKYPEQVGFVVHTRRWVVERLFAWLNRNRRIAKDFEASIASAEASLNAASLMLLAIRLARAS